jgi:nucleoside-diphosphate-sugar epimerase
MMDLQYVEDVAGIFVRCLFAPLDGAFVFNLQGVVVSMQELIGLLERLRPGAARLISFSGPQIPVAYRMDDSGLRSKVGEIPRTPLECGVRKTLEHFEGLRAARGAPAGR